MKPGPAQKGVSRRTLLIGGGAGAGLAIAWALWPRTYIPNLRAAPGETLFNAFLKIGEDGRVIVAVPQAELGQGVYTSLPQILADELGADWATVAVEPAPIAPFYANTLLAEGAADGIPSAFASFARWAAREYATREAIMLTGGSSSVRAFEAPLREAGAAARALLSKAAAARWDVDWQTLDTRAGFVVDGSRQLRFGELAVEAAALELPPDLPVRGGADNRLAGRSLPRLDLPSKVDGTARFAGDVRLRDMVYASVRAGPAGASRLMRADKEAADRIAGVLAVFETDHWVGAAATNWWAANRAVEAMRPVFETRGPLPAPPTTETLKAALSGAEAELAFEQGDALATLDGADFFSARYFSGPVANAPLETLTATARLEGNQLEVWAPTQAPGLARAAAARIAGLPENRVTLYPMLIGGGYGRKLETAAIEQAVVMAAAMKRPVQLVWSRIEETMQDSFRPPAAATISAATGHAGAVTAWRARVAAAAAEREDAQLFDASDLALADGAVPPYAIPAIRVELAPVATSLRTGVWRSGARGYTIFFNESFIDELSRRAGVEPMSYRMGMLGDNPRLARCLSIAAALAGWDGGQAGSFMGLAAHSAYGSHAALVVEIAIEAQRIRVARAVCAVDCGRVINPDIVRQQIEGGILFGIAGATGPAVGFSEGVPDIRGFDGMDLPRLADSPEVTVELVESGEEPGGVTELGVPPVAPAIANAVFAATGQRLRSLPLAIGGR